ncbi:MAG: Rnf-Nqr domain containing protein [Gemmiger sp.]
MAKSDPKPNKRKKKGEPQPATLIIPKISPEMLEAARRAAETGDVQDEQQLEQQAAEAARAEEERRAARQAEEDKKVEEARRAAQPAPPRARTRAEERRHALRREQKAFARRVHDDHLWLNNPVIMRGLGLAPVVVAATTGQNALMLCVAVLLLLTPVRVVSVALCHLTGNRGRPLIYSFTGAVLYIPAYVILYALFGNNLSLLGIYLPILVVEPAIVKRMENPDLESVGEAFRRGVNNTVGLCVTTLMVGCLRELLASGTLFGNPVLNFAPLPLAGEPAAGFILVGMLAAGWTGVANAYVTYKLEELKRRYVDRKH